MENTNSIRNGKVNKKVGNKPARIPRIDITENECKKLNILESSKMYSPDISVGQQVYFYDEKNDAYIEGKIALINKRRRWFMIESEIYSVRTGSSAVLRTCFPFSDLYASSYRGVKPVLWTDEHIRWYEDCKARAVEKMIDLDEEIKLSVA